ncbi:stage III sporulation protein SpoIIIAB [Paenibacillus allorhizosphaerae]|uniref:Stage III sporulation protein AB n=1 Tax=Paenibacillus allorhizosphaerae TaxID=2849866 RepID=A0ABM8VHJ5_9BACL|nr:stage III sporulation protein SpoIIIAB [Paenibacillus allorhizosphaerae]CAG7642286.1 Stage III sporulation protein AB [Paenibacillus allorhizosphaerae]
MLKLLGAMLILLSGTLFGFYQASLLARRPKQIAELIRSLQRLETEIVYGFTPLPEALASTGRSCSTPAGRLFLRAAEELRRAEGRSVQMIWRESVSEEWRNTAMKMQEREVFLQIGSTLGLTDKEDQVKHLRLAASQLQTESDNAREEQQRYERMWKSLGVLMGALVVILMY